MLCVSGYPVILALVVEEMEQRKEKIPAKTKCVLCPTIIIYAESQNCPLMS